MAERLLLIEILGRSQEAVRAFRETEVAAGGLGSKFGGLGKAAGILGGAAALGLVYEGLKKTIEVAQEDEVAHGKLAAAFKTTGLSLEKYGKNIDDAEGKGRSLGFTNRDIMDSMARLIIPTKNVGEATRQLSIAQDVSRLKNISLEAATNLLVKAQTGSQRALKALGLSIQPVTAATDAYKEKQKELKQPIDDVTLAQMKLKDMNATAAEVTDKVAAAAKGQGQAYADTASGGMAQFSAQLDNVEGKIGEKLLPIFDRALQWVNQHWPEISKTVDQALKAIGTAIDIIKPIIETFFKIMVAQIKLPIDLIHGDWKAAWGDFKTIVMGPLDIVKDAIKGLVTLITGPASAAWEKISSAAGTAWSEVKNKTNAIWQPVYDKIRTAFNWIKDNVGTIWSTLSDAIKSAWDAASGALGALRDAINGVVDALRALKSAWDGVSGFIGDIGSAIGLHGGGEVRHGGGAVRGHTGWWGSGVSSGSAEVPVIAQRGEFMFSRSSVARLGRGNLEAMNRGGSMMGGGIVLNFHGPVLGDDKRAIAESLANEIVSAMRRRGIQGLPV